MPIFGGGEKEKKENGRSSFCQGGGRLSQKKEKGGGKAFIGEREKREEVMFYPSVETERRGKGSIEGCFWPLREKRRAPYFLLRRGRKRKYKGHFSQPPGKEGEDLCLSLGKKRKK